MKQNNSNNEDGAANLVVLWEWERSDPEPKWASTTQRYEPLQTLMSIFWINVPDGVRLLEDTSKNVEDRWQDRFPVFILENGEYNPYAANSRQILDLLTKFQPSRFVGPKVDPNCPEDIEVFDLRDKVRFSGNSWQKRRGCCEKEALLCIERLSEIREKVGRSILLNYPPKEIAEGDIIVKLYEDERINPRRLMERFSFFYCSGVEKDIKIPCPKGMGDSDFSHLLRKLKPKRFRWDKVSYEYVDQKTGVRWGVDSRWLDKALGIEKTSLSPRDIIAIKEPK
jgi:hypothetical protein